MVEIKDAKCGWQDHMSKCLEKQKTHSKTMWSPILSGFKTYNTKFTRAHELNSRIYKNSQE